MRKTLDKAEIDAFKLSWPCHGLPDHLSVVTVDLDHRGQVADYEALDTGGNWLDLAPCNGDALYALLETAAAKGR